MANELKLTLSKNRTEVELSITGDQNAAKSLTAENVDELIKVLTNFRTEMNPPHAPEYQLGQRVENVILDPLWMTQADRMGEVSLLHLFHPGRGWEHFGFPIDSAQKLADFLQAQINEASKPPPGRPV